MKRLIAATAIAAATLVANPVLANDVSSVIPVAQQSGAQSTRDTADTVANPFGNQDVISIVPAAPAREPSATVASQVLAKASHFGNEDITSTVQ